MVFSLYSSEILPPGCGDNVLLVVQYSLILLLMFLHTVLNVIVAILSSRGAILDEQPRRRVPHCVVAKIVLWVIEVVNIAFGTYVGFGSGAASEISIECARPVVWMVRAVALAGWALVLLLIIGFGFTFDPLGKQRKLSRMDLHRRQEIWENR